MKFWKRIYLSEASVAIMQDMFWWIFLDKFEVSFVACTLFKSILKFIPARTKFWSSIQNWLYERILIQLQYRCVLKAFILIHFSSVKRLVNVIFCGCDRFFLYSGIVLQGKSGSNRPPSGEDNEEEPLKRMDQLDMKEAKDKLFNRISDSFVNLFFSIHPDMKDKFLNVISHFYSYFLASPISLCHLIAFYVTSFSFLTCEMFLQISNMPKIRLHSILRWNFGAFIHQ